MTSRVPVEAEVLDGSGPGIGGLLLFVEDGRLSQLEVFGHADEPLPMPESAAVVLRAGGDG